MKSAFVDNYMSGHAVESGMGLTFMHLDFRFA